MLVYKIGGHMRVFRVFIFCVAASILCSSMVQAKIKPEIEVGWVDFEPFFYEKDNEVRGTVFEKFNIIADKAGYKVNSKVYPMKRLREFTSTGVLDATVLLKVVFKDGEVIASDKMICQIQLRNYTIGKKGLIKVKEDLSGKRIGIYRGFTYGGWIDYIKDPDNNVDYYEVSSHKQLFKMLELGRVDYVLDYRNPSEVALDKMFIDDLKYEVITELPVYLLVSTKSKVLAAKKIIEDFDLAYAKLLKEGQMREID